MVSLALNIAAFLFLAVIGLAALWLSLVVIGWIYVALRNWLIPGSWFDKSAQPRQQHRP